MAKRKALVRWDQELAKHAQAVSDTERLPQGSFVGLRGGQLSVAGAPMKDNKMEVVILDHIFENAYYKGKFDPENRAGPVCFALGREEEGLTPHESSSEPQHDACLGCAQNEFGSADTGRGKACKNTRRLALISADKLSSESVASGDIVYLKLPVTSVKGWSYYVKSLNANYRRPPFGMITEISVVPDPKTQFKVVITPVEPVSDDVMEAIMERRAELKDQIMFPYEAAPAESPAPTKKKRGTSRRKF